MDQRHINSDDDHKAALREIEQLRGADKGTPDGDRLDLLVTLIEAYESKRWAKELKVPNRETQAAMREASALLSARRSRPEQDV